VAARVDYHRDYLFGFSFTEVQIRRETLADVDAIRGVNVEAFGRDAEADLIDRLRLERRVVASLVAEDRTYVVGHILFSRIEIVGRDRVVPAVALAPMAVVPARHREGIGSALVHAGLDACRAVGERICIVVGHLAYYPRFGFSASLAAPLTSPYSGPACMAIELEPGALDGVRGEIMYPAAFSKL